jgi:hypothetical protein
MSGKQNPYVLDVMERLELALAIENIIVKYVPEGERFIGLQYCHDNQLVASCSHDEGLYFMDDEQTIRPCGPSGHLLACRATNAVLCTPIVPFITVLARRSGHRRQAKTKPKRKQSMLDQDYRFTEHKVALPRHDADVTLTLPNKDEILLQWRVDGPTLDVCLPKPDHVVNCWYGHDLAPSPPVQGFAHVRQCGQLCINFERGVLVNPDKPKQMLLRVNSGGFSLVSPKSDVRFPVTLTGNVKQVISMARKTCPEEEEHVEVLINGKPHWVSRYNLEEMEE